MRTEGAMFVLFLIYFHNVIDLANTIHTVTKEKGQVIKNSRILPHKNSIPSKPHAQSYPSLNQMNNGEMIFTRKKLKDQFIFNMPLHGFFSKSPCKRLERKCRVYKV